MNKTKDKTMPILSTSLMRTSLMAKVFLNQRIVKNLIQR